MKRIFGMVVRWTLVGWLPFVPCAPFTAGMVWAGFHPYAVFGVTSFFWVVWLWYWAKSSVEWIEHHDHQMGGPAME